MNPGELRRCKPWRGACIALLLLASCSGSGSSDQPPQQPLFLERFATALNPRIAFDANGVLYATVTQPTVDGGGKVIAGLFSFSADGQPSDRSVSITDPGGLTSDGKDLYFSEAVSCLMHFCDANAGRVAPDGTVKRIAIAGTPFNGGPTAPGQPAGIAVDTAGSIYIADRADEVIRKIAPDGVQTDLAGDGQVGCAQVDGKGDQARFCLPEGLAIDAAGNLYVADRGANTIRKVTPDGNVTTIAGVAFVAGSMDGPAASATFNDPNQVALDGQGNLYVADSGNALIRRISTSGNVTTFAGTRGLQGFAPGPLPGTLDPPTGIAIHGNDLYFAMPSAIGRVRNINGS